MATTAVHLDAAAVRRRFDEAGGFTVGIEEEVMLLDPETYQPAAVAERLLARLKGDPRYKSELPAAQVEIMTGPAATALEAVAQLATARRDLAAAASGLARLAVAGVHPTAGPSGVLNGRPRYRALRREYGPVADRQLVAGLQVHVAVGGAERSLGVYNALRSYLPELMALAANAPFHAGADSQMATVRPEICLGLPRQGVPPPLESWDQLIAELSWGEAAGGVPDPSRWWWELRPHVRYGTLELRVPDAQTTIREAAGVIAIAQALVATLADRHDAGRRELPAATWRIAENRWSAARHGLAGTMADLDSGAPRATRDRLHELVAVVAPAARRLRAEDLLAELRESIHRNGSLRQREAATRVGVRGLPQWLADQFLAGVDRFT